MIVAKSCKKSSIAVQLNKGGDYMNNELMVEKLKKIGVYFEEGLKNEEISKIESTFGFKFPKEIAEFLSFAYPRGAFFFNYRNMSKENIEHFNKFQQDVKEGFLFDIEHNISSMKAMLGDIIDEDLDKESFTNEVMNWLDNSPKLIPFYAHRCFFDGIDNAPIVSFWQANDTIFYGSDFENYLENEFLKPNDFIIEEVSAKIEETGIWSYIVG